MSTYRYFFPLILQKIGTALSFVLFTFFVHLEIKGKEHLKGVIGPLILAANHTSELDVVTFSLAVPFFSPLLPLYYVSNPAEKYKTFGWRSYVYGGAFFNMLGAYPVISGKKDYHVALQNHIFLLEQGRTVCIYPEGKRTRDGNLNPARGGVGYLSYATQAPVVPIAINTFFGLTWREFLLRKRTVSITIGAPLLARDIVPEINPTVDDFKRGAERVMSRIGELLK